VKDFGETDAVNPNRGREEILQLSLSSFSKKKTEIFYFLLRTSQFLRSQTKESRQYALMAKKKSVTSSNTIWRCLFMPNRCGNESFVFDAANIQRTYFYERSCAQSPSERTVSFSILSIADLKMMYIQPKDHRLCSAYHIYWNLTTSAVDRVSVLQRVAIKQVYVATRLETKRRISSQEVTGSKLNRYLAACLRITFVYIPVRPGVINSVIRVGCKYFPKF
jgi:hypothetical protein